MNKLIWLGISASLLAAVANAKPNKTPIEVQMGNESAYVVPENGGGVSIYMNDGRLLHLSNADLQVFKNIDFRAMAEHSGASAKPCVGTAAGRAD